MFPSTLRYIETITNPEGLFSTLSGIQAVIDAEDQPIFCSGNFGTVFKVNTRSGTKALKCFTRHQAGRLFAYRRIAEAISPSKYVIDYQYVEREIFVYDDAGDGVYYPVVLMEWVDGDTLSKHIERAVQKRDLDRLESLSEKFKKLSDWLLDQTFAHNDLKPDNIMVRRATDELVLVDYDGMFVESMAGEQAREFGTEPFQSLNRATAPFDRNVDNYSIAYIRKAFDILAHSPERYSSASLVDFTTQELSEIENTYTVFADNLQYLGSSFEGVHTYKSEERYGFVKSSGVSLISAVFDRVRDFGEDGLAAVCSANSWGFINRDGKVVIPQIYSSCTDFSEGVAAVKIGRKWGFIDIEGRAISRFVYDEAWSPRHELAMVRRKGKYGFVGLDGKIAVSLKFDFAQNFTTEAVACVKVEDRYGYIDRRGKWWERPVYHYAQSFHNGIAAVELNGREFFITFDRK